MVGVSGVGGGQVESGTIGRWRESRRHCSNPAVLPDPSPFPWVAGGSLCTSSRVKQIHLHVSLSGLSGISSFNLLSYTGMSLTDYNRS